jgi:uncharacterized phage-associated protein
MTNYNSEKFKELLNYIISKVGSQSNVGKTVLYKLLYFADFDYYETYQEFLSGEEYRKIDYGPAPCHFSTIIEELEDENKIRYIPSPRGSLIPEKYISITDFIPNLLTTKEIKIIDEVIKKYGGFKATKISELSHQDIPWKATEDSQIIDYDLVLYRTPFFSVEDE